MSSVLRTEKSTRLAWAIALKRPKTPCRVLELEREEREDVVTERSCT